MFSVSYAHIQLLTELCFCVASWSIQPMGLPPDQVAS